MSCCILIYQFYLFQESIDDDNGVVEDNWDMIPESALKCIVTIHDQLFGSPDLFEKV